VQHNTFWRLIFFRQGFQRLTVPDTNEYQEPHSLCLTANIAKKPFLKQFFGIFSHIESIMRRGKLDQKRFASCRLNSMRRGYHVFISIDKVFYVTHTSLSFFKKRLMCTIDNTTHFAAKIYISLFSKRFY